MYFLVIVSNSFANKLLALNVLNTLAVKSFINVFKYSFKSLVVILSNISSPLSLLFLNSRIFLYIIGSTLTFLTYRTLSFPKKSNLISLSSKLSICSTLNDITPTVSASSSPFSFPTLKAKLSIKYNAVANCLVLVLSLNKFS